MEKILFRAIQTAYQTDPYAFYEWPWHPPKCLKYKYRSEEAVMKELKRLGYDIVKTR